MLRSKNGAQKAKITEKVHKPALAVNVINFELNRFNASIWVPWSPSDTKSYNALIKVFKFIRYVERNKMHFCLYSSISVKLLHREPGFSDVGKDCELQGKKSKTVRKHKNYLDTKYFFVFCTFCFFYPSDG